jgi:glycosyltransferase involved in cell wall biosynthesis
MAPTMRLLVVGHSYLTTFAQSKYVAMKQLDPTFALRIVTPPTMKHPFMDYRHQRHPALLPEEVIVIPVFFGRSHMTYVLNPRRLLATLREFRPTHIHIEEDPHSMVGFETVILARLASRQAKISFFIWDNLGGVPRFPVNLIKRALTCFGLARASLVICGNQEAERILKSVKGYRGLTAVLPQLGLEPADYDGPVSPALRARLAGPGDGLLIGFLGRFIPEKGLGILLEAMWLLQHLQWTLLLVGSGPMMGDVRQHWQPLLGSRLVCLDAVAYNEMPAHLKCLDIFVLPSYRTKYWQEQFGLTLAQAMLAGTACIGTSSGAIPEVLDGSGVIVAERDVNALAGALENLIGSAIHRQEMKAKAKSVALQRYTNIAVARKQLDALTTISHDLA